MAGIYLHIPFCRKACRYCDFHFTVSLTGKEEMVKALKNELESRTDYLGNEEISTIYFGGGTPSVLSPGEFVFLMDQLHKLNLSDEIEISFEANPDDLTTDYLPALADAGVTRLSIGIQSFYEDDLRLMRRSHNVRQAFDSIERAIITGFGSLNIDLIYGLPGMDLEKWQKNLEIATGFNIPHISAYHITFEPRTVFDHWRKKGRLVPLDEEKSIEQFKMLRVLLIENGYQHYEISNFARNGHLSRHNVNYWKQIPYIGIGPSAHSYNGSARRWNIASNKKYLAGIFNKEPYYEEEELSPEDLYNEYILTSLRTMWGIDLDYIMKNFGEKKYGYLNEGIVKFVDKGMIEKNDGSYILTEQGMFLADYIISELFI